MVRSFGRVAAGSVLLLLAAARTGAQGTGDAPPCVLSAAVDRVREACPAGATSAFTDVPASGSVWSLVETREPAAILDRIEGAGLYPGEPARVSASGSSWMQNTVLLDGADLTDPLGGTPLLEADPRAFERVEIRSFLGPAEQGAPGLALRLVPRAAADAWRGALEVLGSGDALQADARPSDVAPAIARLDSLVDLGASASGPLGAATRLLAQARHARVSRFERGSAEPVDARWTSLVARLDWQAGARDALRLTAAGQATRTPATPRIAASPEDRADADGFGGTLRWTRTAGAGSLSAHAAGWTAAQTWDGTASVVLPLERLLDGPVPGALHPARSKRSTLELGGSYEHRAARLGGTWHAPRFGVSLRRGAVVERPGSALLVAESVGGVPARVWEWSWPQADARRHANEAAVWLADRLAWGDRLLVEAGLRVEAARGSAEGAAEAVSWTRVLPRLSARLVLARDAGLALLGGYAEYAHRLTLAPLAYGDPNAPHARVHRWDDANRDRVFAAPERGPLVERTGPGTADDALVTIDAGLKPPRTREWVAGVEAEPGGWRLRLLGVDRRERDLVETVDVGVPLSAYDVRFLPDPSGDILGPQDDQLLAVYERRPESFGLDRYLLTNPDGLAGLHQRVEFQLRRTFGAAFDAALGAAAWRTEAAGANRGFRVFENDQGLIGELHDDPNADTNAKGRTFFDRAYTIKLGLAWAAPLGMRLGAVARYQDGQPFGRLVIVPDLPQGAEAIPATPRGQIERGWAKDDEGRYVVPSGHRFTYTLTVDARLERAWRLGGARLVLAAEAFNLLDQRNSVEEDPTWGPRFRADVATQPPRAFRFGARLEL